jgi:hypothetical protein
MMRGGKYHHEEVERAVVDPLSFEATEAA